jgi:hypothetical protein
MDRSYVPSANFFGSIGGGIVVVVHRPAKQRN